MISETSTDESIKVLFYVQHLLGIGHLMRAKRIVLALRDKGFAITLVTGGMPLPEFQLSGVNHVQLLPMAVGGDNFNELLDSTGKPIDDDFKRRRCEHLLQTYSRVKPDIVIVEAFPFGRRQVRFELLPLISAIEASEPRPLLLSSIRDILQKRIKPGRDADTAKLVKQHFDKVLVHGDPEFAALESSYPYAKEISGHIVYTGLVSGAVPPPGTDEYAAIVSAGGGAVGLDLIRAAIEASRELPEIESWCVVTGPNLPDPEFSALSKSAPANVNVEKFRPDFDSLLARAQLSVSQAGYNTVSDILQAGCRAILVPFSTGGETEQGARAQRLSDLGLAHVLSEEELSATSLASLIRTAMAKRKGSAPLKLNVEGADNTADILRRLFLDKQ